MITHRLQITPNTGHHAFWIPFDHDTITSLGPEAYDSLVDLARRPSRWKSFPQGNSFVPHIRYRVANAPTGKDVPGIAVIIESNLGDHTRGAVFSAKEPVAETPFIGQPPTKYAFRADTEIPEGRTEEAHKLELQYDPDRDAVPVLSFEVHWTVTMATNPIPVDLIIDFGNSRTTAVLLEQMPGASDGSSTSALRRMVQPLKFFTRDAALYTDETIYPRGESIINSWFVLSQPRFSDSEIPQIDEAALLTEYNWEVKPAKKNFFGKVTEPESRVTTSVTRRVSQTFAELSPLTFGPGSDVALLATNPQGGGIQMLSSPKRYAWANDPAVQEGTPFWSMLRNLWDADVASAQNAKLASQVLRFFPHDGTDWDLSEPPSQWEPTRRPSCNPIAPNYPKADSLAWMGLGILEAAFRWINCREYSKENLPYVKRFIRSVKLTYPSGWTDEELKAYENKWKKAVNIFHLGHHSEEQAVPEVAFPLDEAIASQLPFVFSEIEAMHGIGENYLELVGKKRGREQTTTVRALNIDIGGGTTDFAIVEYSDKLTGSGVELEAKVLFKDSTNVAGDEVVKSLIERIILPAYGQHLAEEGEEYKDAYTAFFREPFKSAAVGEEWKRATLGFFVPLAVRCIKFLGSKENNLDLFSLDDDGEATYGVEDIARKAKAFFKEQGLDAVTVSEKFEFGTFPGQFFSTEITKEAISGIISEVLTPVIRRLAKFVSAFDVDLVILSGKPSEAPVVRDLVVEHLPISEDRLITAKNYHSGDWYPFATNGRISDAKTVTVVGLALYEAISRGYVPGWAMRQITADTVLRKNHWLLLPLNASQEPTVFLRPEQDEATVDVLVNARIARKLLPSTDAPEPTYVLRWRSKETPQPNRIKATLRRVARQGDRGTERLELVSAVDATTERPISTGLLRLEICTIQQEDYWLDSPRFEIHWPQP